VSTVIASPPARRGAGSQQSRRRRTRRLATWATVVVAAVVAVVGLRLAVRGQRPVISTQAPTTASAARAAALPSNPALEAAWGMRFTRIVMLADNGLLEVRYQVTNPAKSARLHSGGDVQNLPTLVDETRGTKVEPHSLMLHFHHAQTATVGVTYSILYGNSGGAIHVGDKITIRMTDGLTLRHVIVST
jgi:hypothetical protein